MQDTVEVHIESTKIDDLRQQVISGIGWATLSQIVQQILQFAISVILARLLAPRDFGLVATITVFTGFAALLGGVGLGTALIQRDKLDDRHLSSVFWINVFTGVTLTLVFVLAAPAIATFYGEPLLSKLTRVIALNFILTALSNTQATILRRSMNFRVLAIRGILALVASGVCGIGLALAGYGVWSLVGSMLVASFCTLLWLWTATVWRPRFEFHSSAVAELLGFSSNMLGANILNYFTRNVDNLLVGRFLGSAALGLYARAYSMMLLPLTQVTFVIQTVMFPALSKLQHDHERTRQIYLRALSFIALVTFPLMLGLFVVSEKFVLVLFTEKWAGMIPILRILCLVGLVQSITSSTRWIYASQGRSDWMLRWGLFSTALTILSFIPGILLHSLKILAIGYAAVNFSLIYWEFSIPGQLIGLKFRDVIGSLRKTMVCAIVMSLAITALDYVSPNRWSDGLILVGDCLVGFLTYISLIHLFNLPAYQEARTILTNQLQHTLDQLRLGLPKLHLSRTSGSRDARKCDQVVVTNRITTPKQYARTTPIFTVIIPTHNRAALLKQAINSVLEQTFVDFELLVVDDHSSDNTQDVVREISDSRVRLIVNDRTPGGAGARNAGIFRARGEWIAFLDDDDAWLPEKLERQYAKSQEVTNDISLIYTGVFKCSSDLTKILFIRQPKKQGDILNEVLYTNYIGTYSSVIIRASTLHAIRGLDEAFPAMQDKELYIRVAMVSRVAYVAEPLVLYRTNVHNTISSNMDAKLAAALLIRQKYWNLIKRNLRQRHRAASRIFAFAWCTKKWRTMWRELPWTMVGFFCDPPNMLWIFNTMRTALRG